MEQVRNINWQVEKRRLVYTSPTSPLESSRNALVRCDTHQELAVVSDGYQILQNSELIGLAEKLERHGVITDVQGTCFDGGKLVYIKGKLTGAGTEVLPGDRVTGYFGLFNRHTGKDASGFISHNHSHLCKNVLGVIDGNRTSDIVRLPHTGNLEQLWCDTVKAIDINLMQFNRSIEIYRMLARKPMNDVQLRTYVCRVVDPSFFRTDTADKIVPSSVEAIIDHYKHGTGQDIKGRKGTYWGGYNAVTHWLTHSRGYESRREQSVLLGQGRIIRNRALEYAIYAGVGA